MMSEPVMHEESGDNLAARQVALGLLHGVLGQKQALDHVLDRDDGFKSLPPRDRGFCRMLVTTAIRRIGQIEAILDKAMDQPGRASVQVMHILRLGATQILFMDVPDHAAVDTSVRLAEEMDLERQKGFINGALRTITRKGTEWLSKQDETRLNTP